MTFINPKSQNHMEDSTLKIPEANQQIEIETLSEKQDTQKFWRKLIFGVFGIVNQDDYIEFEKRILIGQTKFIILL